MTEINLVRKIRKSSNISWMSFVKAGDHTVMRVGFRGKAGRSYYTYEGVPEEVYQRIVSAESVGKAFIELVRNHDEYHYKEHDLPRSP